MPNSSQDGDGSVEVGRSVVGDSVGTSANPVTFHPPSRAWSGLPQGRLDQAPSTDQATQAKDHKVFTQAHHRSYIINSKVQKVQLEFTKSNGDCWRAHRLDGLRPTNARLATLKPGPHERVQRWHAWRPVARSPNHREAPASNASTPGLCNAALRICIATCKHHPTCGQTSPASTPALCNAPCSGSAARSADRTSPARDPHRVRLSTCIAGHPRHAPNQAQHLHAASCPSESGEEASAM